MDHGSLELEAEAEFDVENPDEDPDDHITLAELTGTSISELVEFEAEGEFEVKLPFNLSLGGFDPEALPVLEIVSEDLFDPAAIEVKVEDFENLLDFSHLSPAAVFALIRQLADAVRWHQQ